MVCPKCKSNQTGKVRGEDPEEWFCLGHYGTFYDTSRVIRDSKPIYGAVSGKAGRKQRPIMTGVREIYKSSKLV